MLQRSGPRKAATLGQSRGREPLATYQVLIFFALVVLQAILAGYLVRAAGLTYLTPYVLDTGLYAAFLIPPLARVFSPEVFSAEFWRLPRSSWKSICGMATLKLIVIQIPPHGDAMTMWYAVSALIFAPPLEEIVRAVMIPSLVARWGVFGGILITSVLFAFAHPGFIRPLVYQLALSTIFVVNKRSIPATALSHFVMNAIAVAYLGIIP